jgi:DHA2 family methylenomycin A resistance protein-like MFS transporter
LNPRQAGFHSGFAISTVAYVACALASNATILIVARGIEGWVRILVPNSLALLNHAYPNTMLRGR